LAERLTRGVAALGHLAEPLRQLAETLGQLSETLADTSLRKSIRVTSRCNEPKRRSDTNPNEATWRRSRIKRREKVPNL
jgi:hypothetical protein